MVEKGCKILMKDVGSLVKVDFDGPTLEDCILLELDTPADAKEYGYRSAEVFMFNQDWNADRIQYIYTYQIKKVGPVIKIPSL